MWARPTRVLLERGPAIDLAAPVSGIWAPRYLSSAASQGEAADPPPGESDPAATAHNRIWYGKFGGTSAAAPYTSAVIALMLQANPVLRPAEVAAILTRTAQDYGAAGWDGRWGWGEVRALAAVQAALGARFAQPVAPAQPAPSREVLPATGGPHHWSDSRCWRPRSQRRAAGDSIATKR
jgi:subtilisin family serine protease